jgi:hypothetical protein
MKSQKNENICSLFQIGVHLSILTIVFVTQQAEVLDFRKCTANVEI